MRNAALLTLLFLANNAYAQRFAGTYAGVEHYEPFVLRGQYQASATPRDSAITARIIEKKKLIIVRYTVGSGPRQEVRLTKRSKRLASRSYQDLEYYTGPNAGCVQSIDFSLLLTGKNTAKLQLYAVLDCEGSSGKDSYESVGKTSALTRVLK